MNLSLEAEQVLADFAQCKSWQDRTKLLIKYGTKLDDFPLKQKTETNLIAACEVKSWLIGVNKPVCNFKAASEAKITKGLLALLLVRVNGQTLQEVKKLDLNAWFEACGLNQNLTASKRNGLNAAWQLMCR